jgi:hypothetical protein
MTVRFKPNPLAGAILSKTPEMTAFLYGLAETAVSAAQSVAPVRSGEYRDSIAAYPGVGKARVQASDFKAVWIEFGTGQPGPTAAFAPLRRGAEAAGLQLSGG